jgi:streptogramin lyase
VRERLNISLPYACRGRGEARRSPRPGGPQTAASGPASSHKECPEGITAGPDGALWFTNAGNNSIGRITTTGTVTNYTGTGISDPGVITTGPGGVLWFTNGTHSVGEITTSGAVTVSSGHGVSHPLGITAVPNATLEVWFTDSSDNLMSQGILR